MTRRYVDELLRGGQGEVAAAVLERAQAGTLLAMSAPCPLADSQVEVVVRCRVPGVLGDDGPGHPFAGLYRPQAAARASRVAPVPVRPGWRGEPLALVGGAVGALAVLGLTVWGALALWAWVLDHLAAVIGWGILAAVAAGVLALKVPAARKAPADGCRWLLVHLCGGGR